MLCAQAPNNSPRRTTQRLVLFGPVKRKNKKAGRECHNYTSYESQPDSVSLILIPSHGERTSVTLSEKVLVSGNGYLKLRKSHLSHE